MSTIFGDVGPAFPGQSQHESHVDINEGMSLLDWFAGQALAQLIHRREMTEAETYSRREVCVEAYHYAQEMISERSRLNAK